MHFKGTAKAIAMVRPKSKGLAHGTIKVNKKPLLHFVDNILILKFQDCLSAIGADNLALMKIDIKVTGGGSVSRLYAVLQALCKGSIAYLGKYVDEDSMARLKEKLLALDKTLLIKDSRRTRPKRFGGAGANARYRKSYR
ncbi:MAG: 40S ribosomal protein S16 [Marteilia pararefringens]